MFEDEDPEWREHVNTTTWWGALARVLLLLVLVGGALALAPRLAVGAGFRTMGRFILDGQGRPFLPHGLNRPSLEWNPQGVMLSRKDVARMASWGANVIRIPTNQDFLLPDSCRYAPGYLARVEQLVRWVNAAGMEALIDLHWSDRGERCIGKMGQQEMPDERSVRFWQIMARAFRSNPQVFLELYNEPHAITWSCWLRGCVTSQGWRAVGMQELYDTVRRAGFTGLVFIDGRDWARDLSGVPSHMVRGYNIVYATHPYDATVDPAMLDAAFGDLAGRYPIVATEFGPFRNKTPFCSPAVEGGLIRYFEAPDGRKQRAIGWIAWAWYAASNVCTFPAVIRDWQGNPAPNGVPVQAALLRYRAEERPVRGGLSGTGG